MSRYPAIYLRCGSAGATVAEWSRTIASERGSKPATVYHRLLTMKDGQRAYGRVWRTVKKGSAREGCICAGTCSCHKCERCAA